jgi:GDPmannose 4,6-dehydratase
MCQAAFSYAALDMDVHVVIDPDLFRPAEVDVLHGDPSKARQQLGWEPTIAFEDMIREMVEADLRRLSPLRRARALPEVSARPMVA